MQLFKFNLLIFLITLSLQSKSAFELDQCISMTANVSVSHKAFPFGLLKRELGLNKEGCLLKVKHTTYKYLKDEWIVDVCRGPVHIKKDNGGIEVFKRTGACENRSNDYCKHVDSILKSLQDDGLIFASGQKENIETEHGKIYCSFLLLKNYLENGYVFSKDGESSDSFSSGKFNTSEKQEIIKIPVPDSKNDAVEEKNSTSPLVDGPADF